VYSNFENIRGSTFNDILTGNTANNVLEGGGGADQINGGSGIDTASYEHSDAGVTVILDNTGAASFISDGDATGDTLSSIENLRGSAFMDTLTGNSSDNLIEGGIEADTLDGGGNTILGDTLSYEHSAASVTIDFTGATAILRANGGDATGDIYTNFENIRGSAFNDTLTGDANANILNGNTGNDTLAGNAGADTLNGGSGNDILIGGTENDILNGDDGDDILDGSADNDTLNGGNGNDVLIGGSGADILNGTSGIDIASYETALTGVTASLTTPAINTGDALGDTYSNIDNLRGSDFDDILTGDNGDNVLEGRQGGDQMNGGLGLDTASYANATTGVSASLLLPATNTGEAIGDTYTSIEILLGSAFSDTLIGDNGNNVIEGGLGADTLDGGSNTLAGDTLSYEHSSAAVTINFTGATAALKASGGSAVGDIYSNFENIRGSAFNDTLTGDANANILNGDAGVDTLNGNEGIDTLNGDDGNDILIGGVDGDILNGGNGTDTASYETALVGVTASLLTPGSNTGDAAGDTYTSVENLRGSSFNDTLTGDSGVNVLEGGLGADTLDGGLGVDTASYSNATTGVSASLSLPATNTGEAFGDTYANIENLLGSIFDDVLNGNASANSLSGNAGNDLLIGGAGADSLDGGTGTDIASYETALGGVTASLLTPGSNTGDALGDTYTSIENLRGSAFSDILTGNNGDNILEGGLGGDTLNGGLGIDTASYTNAATGVSASLSVPASNTGEALGDTFTGIENLLGSAFSDTLEGDINTNILTGGTSSDTFVFQLDTIGGLGKVGNDADIIVDLTATGANADILQFKGAGANLALLDASSTFTTTSVGGLAGIDDTVVTFSGGGSITFYDITLSSFAALEALNASVTNVTFV
jgi:Ca2+-binding RTX toxin-like protein